ncbi:metal ABC transporter ATP-binding protein [Lamprocystis purpurea]|jgi:zinc transport system ATP-binding protein|uniref:metal ABC transporter ATP-binding protein n=1 Tax=Lamprocystis purpurea TaxID=61598 RepID=UPI00036F1736|nr:ABC transporter ATP-binding protein [Lamprocystis purpurea]
MSPTLIQAPSQAPSPSLSQAGIGTGSQPVIAVENLGFSYGDNPVLVGVDLTIAAGEFLGLVGPNAGGKSTLLKLMLGLLAPQTGRIQVLGMPPRAARRYLGYVPQYPTFPRDFPISVEQVVLMGRLGLGPPLGWYRPADRAAVRTALAEVEALDLAARRIGTLSGGQLQRVLLARALVGEPRILILDEPTANIDQRVEGDIFELLARLNARLTILVVSHDIAFISGFVHRVACLNRTLICHRTDAVDGDLLHRLYHADVRAVAHGH